MGCLDAETELEEGLHGGESYHVEVEVDEHRNNKLTSPSCLWSRGITFVALRTRTYS